MIGNTREAVAGRGPWILFDNSCGLCRTGARGFGPIAQRRGFRLAPLQSSIGAELDTLRTDEMKVVTREGDVLGGAAAFAHVAQFVWWAWPLAFVWRFEICRKALRGVYRRVAENRHCVDAVCGISPRDAQRGLDLSVRQHDRKTQETAHPPDEENPYALEL